VYFAYAAFNVLPSYLVYQFKICLIISFFATKWFDKVSSDSQSTLKHFSGQA
jgi:hypothetical protein